MFYRELKYGFFYITMKETKRPGRIITVDKNVLNQWLSKSTVYSPPKWIMFCKHLFDDGWSVKVKMTTKTFSKYVYVRKGEVYKKIRFSNHEPGIRKDSDLYVGHFKDQILTTLDVIRYLKFLCEEEKEVTYYGIY